MYQDNLFNELIIDNFAGGGEKWLDTRKKI